MHIRRYLLTYAVVQTVALQENTGDECPATQYSSGLEALQRLTLQLWILAKLYLHRSLLEASLLAFQLNLTSLVEIEYIRDTHGTLSSLWLILIAISFRYIRPLEKAEVLRSQSLATRNPFEHYKANMAQCLLQKASSRYVQSI